MSMSVSEQPVAHPPDVENERSVAVADSGEPPSQTGRVRVECARTSERLKAPYLAEELLLREDARGIRGQLEQQLVFLGGQVDSLAADGHAPRRAVDLDVADLEAIGGQRLRPP